MYLLFRLEVNVLLSLKGETLNQFELGMTVACFSFPKNFVALFGYFVFAAKKKIVVLDWVAMACKVQMLYRWFTEGGEGGLVFAMKNLCYVVGREEDYDEFARGSEEEGGRGREIERKFRR